MSTQVMIELGCGTRKTPGYIGVDRFPLKNVDVVADLNKELPFEDNSIDVVLACHSLEHLENFRFTIGEIFRICKHGAIVLILAPYYYTTTNIANPYHYVPFNESTFQFFCNYPNEVWGVDPEEYYCPHAKPWGLGKSDNSDNPIDFGLVGMEFFYAKEYAHLSTEEKRHARRSLNNVCDQIYYCLVANKSNASFTQEELSKYSQRAIELTPERIHALRNRSEEKSAGLIEDIQRPLWKQFEIVQKFIEKDLRTQEHKNAENSVRFSEINLHFKKLESYHSVLQKQFEALTQQSLLKDEIIADLQNRLKEQSMFVADVIRKQENSLIAKLNLYRKCHDLTRDLNSTCKDFVAQIQQGNHHIHDYLTFSNILPWANVKTYSITSNTGIIQVLISGMKYSSMLFEAVQHGAIVWQEHVQITSDNIYTIHIGCQGTYDLRIRALEPGDIIRILEWNHRKHLIRKTASLAYADGTSGRKR